MPSTVHERRRDELHAAIDRIPNESVELLTSVVTEFESSKREIKNVFLARAVRAVMTLAEDVPVEAATAAPTDFDLLLTLLQQPEAMEVLRARDPLADAKIRGLMAQRQLLEAEGGCMSSEEVAKFLGIKRQAVDKRRGSNKLIGLPAGRNYVYPAWQFVNGKTLSGLEQVLDRLGVRDPWMQAAWMINGNSRLQGQSPLLLLRSGNLEAVLEAAEIYGQGAA